MAHQAHNIPWHQLASHLKYRDNHGSRRQNGITNLYPRYRPNQAKDWNYFLQAFAKNIEEHSLHERKKYRDEYPIAAADEVVITDEVFARMANTFKRAPIAKHSRWHIIGYVDGLPRNKRTMASFLHAHQFNHCFQFEEINGQAWRDLEPIKALLLHAEMDTLLRICSHPDIQYLTWWSVNEHWEIWAPRGWDVFVRNSLIAYLCLNVFYCFPELYDEGSKRHESHDYRSTKAYQMMLRTVCMTLHSGSQFANLPHRDFFGISDDHFREHPGDRYGQRTVIAYEYGKWPIEMFLDVEVPSYHVPSGHDVEQVMLSLQRKGLPAELQLQILELAHYKGRRRLPILRDPLHFQNRTELQKYLKYCWQTLVRCDVMARAMGGRIPWDQLVGTIICDLWGTRSQKFMRHRDHAIWTDDIVVEPVPGLLRDWDDFHDFV